MKKRIFLFALAGLSVSFSGNAQSEKPLFNAMKSSISLEVGPAFTLNYKTGLGASGTLSANIYRGWGISAGYRMGGYRSPDIPPDYISKPLLGQASSGVYNYYTIPYGLVTYEWFPPQVRHFFARAGVGLAATRSDIAHFKEASSDPWSVLRFSGSSHDVEFVEESTFGIAAQFGTYFFRDLGMGKCAYTIGLIGWTAAAAPKRLYGAELQIGFLLPIRTTHQGFEVKK